MSPTYPLRTTYETGQEHIMQSNQQPIEFRVCPALLQACLKTGRLPPFGMMPVP